MRHLRNIGKINTISVVFPKTENVVMGMNLLEILDEEVYYDGICTKVDCQNDLALRVGNWRT